MKVVMRSRATKEGRECEGGKPIFWELLPSENMNKQTIQLTKNKEKPNKRNSVIPLSVMPFWSAGAGIMLGVGAFVIVGSVIESYFASKGNYEVAEVVNDLMGLTIKIGAFAGVCWFLIKVTTGGGLLFL